MCGSLFASVLKYSNVWITDQCLKLFDIKENVCEAIGTMPKSHPWMISFPHRNG